MVLTLLYAGCSGTLDLFKVLERSEASGQRVSLLFLLGVSILDTIFYYWTFLSLSILLKQVHRRELCVFFDSAPAQLSTRRTKLAMAKMILYKTLWWILLGTVLFSVGLIVAQVVMVTTTNPDDTWEVLWWLRSAAWDIGYYVVLGIALGVGSSSPPSPTSLHSVDCFSVPPHVQQSTVCTD